MRPVSEIAALVEAPIHWLGRSAFEFVIGVYGMDPSSFKFTLSSVS